MDSPDQTKKGLPIGVDHGIDIIGDEWDEGCLLYTSPSPRDRG